MPASSDALHIARVEMTSQDEAQDALYFHHDGLWKARAHHHDVYGALCVLSTPGPTDGPPRPPPSGDDDDDDDDVTMRDDDDDDDDDDARVEAGGGGGMGGGGGGGGGWKLVLGEVGEASSNDDTGHGNGRVWDKLPWRVVLEDGGGSVRLTYGAPRELSTAEALRDALVDDDDDDDEHEHDRTRPSRRATARRQYPMEARLSVLSEEESAPWKLLSVRVRCMPKTGESDHRLVMNRKQMFDLHRICERAMIVEEAVCRKAIEGGGTKGGKVTKNDVVVDDDIASCHDGEGPKPIVPRPLLRLFEVTHAFALSLQMELLSSQAEALRLGAWGGPAIAGPVGGIQQQPSSECIAVSPAYFYDKGDPVGGGSSFKTSGDNRAPDPIAVMAVHFWSCDNSYGSPRVGDLSPSDGFRKGEAPSSTMPSGVSSANYLPMTDRRGDRRLSLCIRALPTVGLIVSLSGGSDVAAEAGMRDGEASASGHHMQRNIDKLLSSIQNPFELSMSDALLAATVLCADRRCRAMVAALNNGGRTNELPSCIYLEVECGTISVAAIISYPIPSTTLSTEAAGSYTVLFRLACDSRTGRFVPVFPRSASLLRLLACNDPSSSDIQSLRSSAIDAISANARGGNGAKRSDITSRNSTGRVVRDCFDALARSMDTLGRKCGVGGEWNDLDAQSASLRDKSVNQTCRDVRVSLMTCCGVATAFGVAAIALKIACGVDPVADMAGGPISDESNSGLILVPPLSVPLRQRIVENLVKEGDGESKRVSRLQGEMFAVSAKISNEAIEMVCFDVLTVSESASSVPTRLEYAQVFPQKAEVPISFDAFSMPPPKKPRITKASDETSKCHHMLQEAEHASLWLDSLLRQ
ncbi:LOW QUALITY PROTEIN: hypothetical protein ACHAXA_003308 [Cyclostephanos tholiformis]|uniref:Mediator of RNA polymerase II transcription subunit 17 n=1 Tax=Cyclostephanos tholiformis TaxID=382380 RepID=A0ABD3SBJ6_9STRA